MLTALEEDMNVAVHEGPPVNGACAFDNELAESFKEPHPVLVVLEDGRLIDPTHHDVVQGTRNVKSGLPWHTKSISKSLCPVNNNALKTSTLYIVLSEGQTHNSQIEKM